MTGKGGPTSAPPAVNHQRRAQDDAFGVHQRTDKIAACGVHGSHHEGLTIRAARWSTLGRPLVRQKRSGRTTSQLKGFTVATMNPFMTERRRCILMESSWAESAAQFFVCEQTTRINGRRTTTTMGGNPTGASGSQSGLPGGRDISSTSEYRGFTRSRLPSFAICHFVVPTMLRSPTEVLRQIESP